MSNDQHNAPSVAPRPGFSVDCAPRLAPYAVMYWDGGERAITPREKILIEEHGPSSFGIPLAPATLPDPTINVEAMLVACVPGGSVVDPQLVADNLRAWFSETGKPAGNQEGDGMGPFLNDAVTAASLLRTGHQSKPLADRISNEAFRLRALAATDKQVGGVHPDHAAVDAFADAMKVKMADARAKGRGGWEDPAQCSAEDLSRMLRDHVEKGDPRDVANFCMMLHQRREAIAARQQLGQEPVGYLFTDDPAVYAMPGSGFHSGKEPPADAINVVPVYAAPPAQGIDLGHARAIELLLAVAEAAYTLADNSNDMEDCENVEHADFVALSDALDALDELPDDQPGYTMSEPEKARWALRALTGQRGAAGVDRG